MMAEAPLTHDTLEEYDLRSGTRGRQVSDKKTKREVAIT